MNFHIPGLIIILLLSFLSFLFDNHIKINIAIINVLILILLKINDFNIRLKEDIK